MKEKYYIKFHDYLKDVVKHFQETGSMRHFSDLSKKHKCTKITIPLFYEYCLHQVEGEPSRKLSDTIRDRILEDGRKRRGAEVKTTRFKKGEIIAWMKDGRECVAVVSDDDMFSYCINYDFDGNWFVCDEIPTDVEFINPSYTGLMELARHLADMEASYREKYDESLKVLFP